MPDTEYRKTVDALRLKLAESLATLCEYLLSDLDSLKAEAGADLEHTAALIHGLARRYKATVISGFIHTARQQPTNNDLLRFIRQELKDPAPYEPFFDDSDYASAGGGGGVASRSYGSEYDSVSCAHCGRSGCDADLLDTEAPTLCAVCFHSDDIRLCTSCGDPDSLGDMIAEKPPTALELKTAWNRGHSIYCETLCTGCQSTADDRFGSGWRADYISAEAAETKMAAVEAAAARLPVTKAEMISRNAELAEAVAARVAASKPDPPPPPPPTADGRCGGCGEILTEAEYVNGSCGACGCALPF